MTVKETAGKLLLYFYQLQRTAPLQVRVRQIVFSNDGPASRLSVMADKRWLVSDLQSLSSSAEDLMNGMHYLKDNGFIRTSERSSSEKRAYTGFELTAQGIALIEGVELDSSGVAAFNQAFNLDLGSETKVANLTNSLLGAAAD